MNVDFWKSQHLLGQVVLKRIKTAKMNEEKGRLNQKTSDISTKNSAVRGTFFDILVYKKGVKRCKKGVTRLIKRMLTGW